MAKEKIQRVCFKCNGVGIHYTDTEGGVIETNPCPVCNGEKYVTIEYLDLSKLKIAFDELNGKLDTIIGLLN